MRVPCLPTSGARSEWCAWMAVLLCACLPLTSAVAQDDADAPAGDVDETAPYEVFHDFVHFARVGRFDAAQAAASQLLSVPDLNPVTLLTVAERDPRSIDTLLLIVNKTEISEVAQKVLDLIRAGEYELRKDPGRIKLNIEKLGGPPQMEYNAIQRLRESGELAIPWMIDALTDPDRRRLVPRIVRALPKIGQGAVGPLVQAIDSEDFNLQLVVANALGELGYSQAVPYLQRLAGREGVSEASRQAASAAVAEIQRRSGRGYPGDAAQNFTRLAEEYYDEEGADKADPRLPQANLWIWQDGFLTAVPVPTEVFGPAMAMRCAQHALQLDPDSAEAIALWLAADFRREARLGMNVESVEPDDLAARDPSVAEDLPRSIYFARTAGPIYCHRVLERAVADRDAAVALGAIAALRATAGPMSLIGTEDYKQPLVQALKFPERLVRIKAALALSDALPKTPFAGMEFVPSVLSEALTQPGAPEYVVIDPDKENLNRVMAALRGGGAVVVGDPDFFAAMSQARADLVQVDCFFVATDVGNPGLFGVMSAISREAQFAMTPIVLVTKPAQLSQAEQLASKLSGVEQVDALASAEDLGGALERAVGEVGRLPLDPETALKLALDAATVLRRVALDGRTVIRFEAVEPALIGALGSDKEELQVKVAAALALIPTQRAQEAIARLALSTDESNELRVALFGSLAESARIHGNLLGQGSVDRLITYATDEPDLILRTSASKALGALNLVDNRASEIIRRYRSR